MALLNNYTLFAPITLKPLHPVILLFTTLLLRTPSYPETTEGRNNCICEITMPHSFEY